MQFVKLGKKEPKLDKRTLRLATYLDAAALPSNPSLVRWTSKVPSWPMMANDNVGDCTIASAAHMVEVWTAYGEHRSSMVIPDKDILAAYSAVTGYNPADPSTDNGAYELDVLNYWRKVGIGGHKIAAYAALDLGSRDDIKAAVNLFGGCYIGLNLPVSAQRQSVWSVPWGGPHGAGQPGSWGGHAVPIVGYGPTDLIVVTWGQLKRMTWKFLDTYCEESYAVLSTEWLNQNKSPNGFDLVALQNDLKLL